MFERQEAICGAIRTALSKLGGSDYSRIGQLDALERQGALTNLLALLRSEPRLAEFATDGNTRIILDDRTPADLTNVARWLIERTEEIGLDATLSQLEQYLACDSFEVTFVSGLLAVDVDQPLALSDDVQLIPFTRDDLEWIPREDD